MMVATEWKERIWEEHAKFSYNLKYMLPVQYIKKHEIICYDESIYYFDSDKLLAMDEAMEKNKFIKIWDSRIAVSSIKTVRPAKQEITMVERMIVWLPDQLQDKVKRLVKERKAQEKTVTEQYIQNIIDAG